MNIYLIAVIVGIVEGVTEFLPVSSTGHMVVVGHMLGFDGPLASVFDVFIQLGAILSILFIYKERFVRFFTKEGWQVNKGFSAWHVAAGIVPVALVGLILHGPIKHYLFSPYTVVIGLLAGSVLMMYAEKKMGPKNDELLDDIDKLSLKQAAQIGAYQIFSLWPGFSRSGSTLAGGLLTGVSRDCSAKYTYAGVAQRQSSGFVNRRLRVRFPSPAPSAPYGGVPEWLKGADCKSAGFAFAGSNPAPSTISLINCIPAI
jgi:undecaprenyl-diphosphatase